MPLEMASGSADERRETSPGQVTHQHFTQQSHANSPTLLTDWPMQQSQQLPQYLTDNSLMGTQFNAFGGTFQTSPLDYHLPSTQATFESGLQMEAPFNGLATSVEQQAAMWANWQDIENAMNFGTNDGLPSMGRQSLGSNSPTGTYLEVLSIPSSSSDHGWSTVDHFPNYDAYQQAQNAAIFNPGQTLHLRSHSDSSQSDGTGHTMESFGSFEDISYPYSPYSPDSDNYLDPTGHRNCFHGESHHQHSHETVSPAAAVPPVPIKMSPSSRTTPSTSSPPARRNSAPRKSPTAKATKAVIRRTTSNGKKDTEKRVGRRRGPLLPEQRKQASEIRKLRACLRCKFLKKTCDKGEPCAGCQPSHARLWQVPCTRIDIKDIGYFMKDWRADYERHVGRGVSVYNIKGFSPKEELIWITHGYGFAIPIMAREVYVSDDSCFTVDWVEAEHEEPLEFDTRTERMSAGAEGVSTEALSEYLDKHLDGPFEEFIDDYFEGTPFITEILKTAHRYYVKEKVPVIRKALKLVLAYNLTLHVTMVEQRGDEQPMEGLIDDEDSKYHGKIIAPVMINFQIKCALADMWRELQKEILEELSSLYSSVYSGDRLKNWPTIFMLASILLAVWEEMQFDCHYRVPDPAAVNKFCTDMETTPVGVIVGLFHAISQKLPSFTEWDTRRHGQLLNNNVAVCEAMTEMKDHVTKHGKYFILIAQAISLTYSRILPQDSTRCQIRSPRFRLIIQQVPIETRHPRELSTLAVSPVPHDNFLSAKWTNLFNFFNFFIPICIFDCIDAAMLLTEVFGPAISPRDTRHQIYVFNILLSFVFNLFCSEDLIDEMKAHHGRPTAKALSDLCCHCAFLAQALRLKERKGYQHSDVFDLTFLIFFF
jgi:hypothetical protein